MNIKSKLCFLVIGIFTELASGSGYFELKLQEFYNTNNYIWKGRYCDLSSRSTCENIFEICVNQFPPLPLSFKSCLYHKNSTNVVDGTAVYFQTDNTGIPRSIRINVTKYTGVGFFMKIMDKDYVSEDDHIDDHTYGEALTPGFNAVAMNYNRKIWGRRTLQKSYLTFNVSVSCDQYYYSNTCERYCRPQNDTRGHYQCSNQGYRVCLNGWFVLPGCLVYCVPHEDGHYDCNNTTGEKICLHGWTGDSCNNNNRSRTIDFSSTTSTKPTKVLPVVTRSVQFSASRATKVLPVVTRSVQFSASRATQVLPGVTRSAQFSASRATQVLPVVTKSAPFSESIATKVLPVVTRSAQFSASRATKVLPVVTRSTQFSTSKATKVLPVVTGSAQFSASKATKVLPVVTRSAQFSASRATKVLPVVTRSVKFSLSKPTETVQRSVEFSSSKSPEVLPVVTRSVKFSISRATKVFPLVTRIESFSVSEATEVLSVVTRRVPFSVSRPTKALTTVKRSVAFSASKSPEVLPGFTRSIEFSVSTVTEVFPLVTSSIDFSASKPKKLLPVVTRKISVDPIDWLINTNKGKIVISVAGLVLIIIFIAFITRCRKYKSDAVVPFPHSKVDADGSPKDEFSQRKSTATEINKDFSYVPLKKLSH